MRLSARSALLWIGLAVTVFFTYLAVRNAHLGDVLDALRESDKLWLVPAFLVLALAVFVRAVRWWSLYAPATRPPLGAVTRALLIGYFFNSVLPLRAGEAARIVALHRWAGTSRAESTATAVLERVYDLLALLLLLFAILPWLPPVTWLRAAAILLVALAIGLLGAVVVFARYGARPLQVVLRPLSRVPLLGQARVEGGALNLAQGLAGLRHPRIAVSAAVWTVLSWLLVGVSSWFVLLGFDLGLSVVAGLFVVITINLALVLPSSPGAIGVFEAATVLALRAYGISESEALSYALVLHALNFFPYIAAGLPLLRGGRWRPERGAA
ncbi:MAG: lysylphosphatidylglycerol synthase transmembrane domain-containing protein [Gaiellaceae bacterium]